MKNTNSTRFQFIKKNFLLLFVSFIIPTIIAGIILIYIESTQTKKEINLRLSQSLALAMDNIDSLLGDTRNVNQYAEQSNLVVLNRMMNQNDMDYADSLAAKQFIAFVNSFVNSRNYTDSIYLYLENDINRVFSSTKGFSFVSALHDTQWIPMLLNSDQKNWIVRRTKADYAFEQPREVLTVFNRFSTYQGGTAINYDLAYITQLYDSMKYFPEQYIIVTDSSNNILINTTNITDETSEKLLSKTNNEHYFSMMQDYVSGGLVIYTILPRSVFTYSLLDNSRSTIIIIFMMLGISLILAYVLSVNSYRQLNAVEDIFTCADKNLPLPRIDGNQKDLYSKILQNIIEIFLEKDYLQIQLSERKYRQKVAELQALQYQINPHFLYNTLQTISYEILERSRGQQTKANRMIEDLSDIIRYSLGDSNSHVPLQEEINNCKKYISIQQVRYQNRFQVEWNIDEGLATIQILRLILQPLIENAIVHGIKSKKNGRIRIRVTKRKTTILFWVADNGSGIPQERLQEIRYKIAAHQIEYSSDHIGLLNCNYRLNLEYSNASSLSIYSKISVGTAVVFRIPMEEAMI